MAFERFFTVQDYQWLFLDLNSYFSSVEQQLRPELRGRPTIVVPLLADTTCAIAASYEAKALGIKTGTPVYEAKKRCPGLQIVLARHDVYVEFHHHILREVDRHLPIDRVESIDEVSCRLIGPQCTHHEAVHLARSIKEGICQRVGEHITCSVGIAPNRFLAKVATDMQKPDGLVVLTQHTMQEKLLCLKLEDLPGIGSGMIRRLRQAGIITMAQLYDLSPKQMQQIWGGIGGERFWYALHGIQLQDVATQRRSVGHSHVLAPQLRQPDMAYIVAQRLLLKAAARLRRMGYEATAMDVAIRTEHGVRCYAEARFVASSDTPQLKAELTARWKELMHTAGLCRIRKIAITLHHLQPAGGRQGDLFADNAAQAQRRKGASLSRAMDVLNEKYGRDTVVMGFLPEQSRSFSGTKIAFSRIPEKEEFYE